MNTSKSPLEDRIVSLIAKAAPPLSRGRGARESGTLESLAKRLSVPNDGDHVRAIIGGGHLKDFRPVNKNDPGGAQSFNSDELDAFHREVFASIAQQVIANYDGPPDDLPALIGAAFAAYKRGLADGTAAVGFSARPLGRVRNFGLIDDALESAAVKTARAGIVKAAANPLVRKAAIGAGVGTLGALAYRGLRPNDDNGNSPGLVRTAATGAAIGAAGVGAYALLRRKTGVGGLLGKFAGAPAGGMTRTGAAIGDVASNAAAKALTPQDQFAARMTPTKARALMADISRDLRRLGIR